MFSRKTNVMLFKRILIVFSILSAVNELRGQISEAQNSLTKLTELLDTKLFRPMYRSARTFMLNVNRHSSATSEPKVSFFQEPFKSSKKFPCALAHGRSETIPSDVNKLRPGDIDVISALGDSVTAGIGASSHTTIALGIESRGLSWCVGGQWDWRNSTTLPNILKEFNPNLIGYSLGDSLSTQHASQFNVAEIIAVITDMPYMAKTLVNRIKSDSRVDFVRHWKMVTLLIGANDICTFVCKMKDPVRYVKIYKKYLMETISYLKNNMPRTFVNIVSTTLLSNLVDVTRKPFLCHLIQDFECSCLVGNFQNQTKERKLYFEIQKQFVEAEIEVANAFSGLKEFTVVHQPTLLNSKLPEKSGRVDFSMLANDCFHLSQKGHTIAGISLWNNLLERHGNKSMEVSDPHKRFLCPTEENPYLFTNDNSRL